MPTILIAGTDMKICLIFNIKKIILPYVNTDFDLKTLKQVKDTLPALLIFFAVPETVLENIKKWDDIIFMLICLHFQLVNRKIAKYMQPRDVNTIDVRKNEYPY